MKHLIGIFTVLLLSACASTPEQGPFATSREDVLAKVETIALAPVSFLGIYQAQNDFAQQVEDLVSSELKQAGFEVIPSSVYQSVTQPIVEDAGGSFDPSTGKADTQKALQILTLARAELAEKHGADAVLYPQVTLVKANWKDGMARWDGVSTGITGKTGFGCTAGASNRKGTTGASSLKVTVVDADGTVQYSQTGGIELLSHYDSGFKRVPQSELYRDKERNHQAVQIALGPFVGKEQPKKGFMGALFETPCF